MSPLIAGCLRLLARQSLGRSRTSIRRLAISGDNGADANGKENKNRQKAKDSDQQQPEKTPTTAKLLRPSVMSKFTPVTEESVQTILDYDEEHYGGKPAADDEANNYYLYRDRKRATDPIKLGTIKRGKDTVFTIENLSTLLRLEGMKDIAVIKVDPKLLYCQHIVVATAVSSKHMMAVGEYLLRFNKDWKRPDEPFFQLIGGRQHKDWKVMDMGYIVTHLMLQETRDRFDIETLWCVGQEYDDKTQRPQYDEVVTMMDKHLKYLEELQAAQPITDASTSPSGASTTAFHQPS